MRWVLLSVLVAAGCADDGSGTAGEGTSSGPGSSSTDGSGADPTSTGSGTGDTTEGGLTSATAESTGTGVIPCQPDETRCNGDAHQTCDAEGRWQTDETCDPLQGITCDADTGCVGECVRDQLPRSNVGCDFYPTITSQVDVYTGAGDDFAVAIANTSAEPADVTVTRQGATFATITVDPRGVEVLELQWVDDLARGTGPSTVSEGGAYRLRSTRPVAAYQYNVLVATSTNDASLLLPTHTWGSRYVVASYNMWWSQSLPGFYAVTAMEDGTTVTLVPSATGGSVQAGAGVNADGTGTVALDAGDVLQVFTAAAGMADPDPSDLTGTIVDADRPVQVVGGHKCTQVPPHLKACDHLEESMFPIDTLSASYLVVPPARVEDDSQLKAQAVRIIATEDDTNLTYEPPQLLGPANLASAGDFANISPNTETYRVTADAKIAVVQYMVGTQFGEGDSDPSMVQAMASEQFREQYLFHAQVNWLGNYVDVVAPDGTTVAVDGTTVAGWTAIGATGFSVAHIPLDNSGFGNHEVNADAGVGITVYGVQDSGSYWFPGGAELHALP